jgi:putative transposase
VRFSCAGAPVAPLAATGQEAEIYLRLESFAALSDSTRIGSPGCYRQAERRLKAALRCVSRRKMGGARRRKAVTVLAKAHQKVKRQRSDFQRKTALTLVRANDSV